MAIGLIGIKGEIIPQDTDRTGVKHQGKREFHGISKPTLGKGTKEMAMSNENNIAMLLTVHVTPVNVTDLCNEIINAVGDLLGGSAKDISAAPFFKPNIDTNRDSR